ncbi:methyl-accepting chemotaxis protein [Pelomonas sp. UHG3]|uniref:Methyl-accepting chemotaxis protein n=1 Tax=Roseateles hydrophilus TaxID=2975054 RepID=A0ACC6CBN1_9BURK|nr:methyl-accepting chemotaxis protein [Pelomonas sp. UHG3]MCY4745811.1 methyl-accepting chemotaxis protein [Pelomonas sp. UHG3]
MSHPRASLPSEPSSTPSWARPGVSWFRNMRFTAKATVILLFLLVPILFTTYLLVADRQAAIAATQLERTGLRGVQLVIPAMDATQLLRRALVDQANGVERPDVAELRQRFKAAMDALAKDGKPLLDTLPDPGTEHWQALTAARQAADSQASGLSAAEVRKPYVEISAQLGELTQHLVDVSGLALDPEGDSYYLMMVGTVHLPDLLENLGLTRAALASLAADPQNARLTAQAAARMAVDKKLVETVASELGRVTEFNPTLPVAQHLDHLKPVKALIAQLSPLVMQQAAELPAPAEIVKQASAAIQSLSTLQRDVANELDGLLQAREERLVSRITVAIAIVSVMVLGGLYFFYCFYLSMKSGMRTLTRRMHAMATGDLTDTLVPKGSDETADLLRSLAEMQTSLRGTVRDVREAADAIMQSSQEVAEGSLDLSRRTEQAAANLEETASAMEQISATVASTTDGAGQAARSADGNAQLAQRGGEVIAQVVDTMSGIETSSRRIGEIIGVIDSIAFQTNILALNAAVEAARAGEQGRGFAVVASEVRALAQRSASAAREIKQLILESGERVDGGQRIVAEAGTTIRAIVDSTHQVGELLGSIANGAREQSQGIAQVGASIQELDQMTQQNAALVEQTAAAASSMRQQAEQLAAAVGVFRLP